MRGVIYRSNLVTCVTSRYHTLITDRLIHVVVQSGGVC